MTIRGVIQNAIILLEQLEMAITKSFETKKFNSLEMIIS